jgi:hypothetical protein
MSFDAPIVLLGRPLLGKQLDKGLRGRGFLYSRGGKQGASRFPEDRSAIRNAQLGLNVLSEEVSSNPDRSRSAV